MSRRPRKQACTRPGCSAQTRHGFVARVRRGPWHFLCSMDCWTLVVQARPVRR